MEKSKSFYCDILGFKPGEEMPPGILLNAPGLTFYLEAGRKPISHERLTCTEISPCLSADGIKSAFSALKNAGVEIVTEYVEYAPTFAMFRIADPDGNVFEFAGEP